MTFKASGVGLPAPVKITSNDEIIWSSNTGRDDAGLMLGTVVAEKRTIDITWGVLTQAQMEDIMAAMPAGFFTFVLGSASLTVYRGAFTGEQLGDIGDGNSYYRSLSVSVIER